MFDPYQHMCIRKYQLLRFLSTNQLARPPQVHWFRSNASVWNGTLGWVGFHSHNSTLCKLLALSPTTWWTHIYLNLNSHLATLGLISPLGSSYGLPHIRPQTNQPIHPSANIIFGWKSMFINQSRPKPINQSSNQPTSFCVRPLPTHVHTNLSAP